MKKKHIYIIALVSGLITGTLPYKNINIKKTVYIDYATYDYTANSYRMIDWSDRIKYEEGISLSYIRSVEEEYLSFPKEIQDFMNERDIKICLMSEESFADLLQDDASHVTAVTYEDCVWLNTGSSFGVSAVVTSIAHEIGHRVDQDAVYSSSDDFVSVVSDHKELLKMRHINMKNDAEYFAEGFWYYLKRPGTLLENAPDLYDYYASIFPIEREVLPVISGMPEDDFERKWLEVIGSEFKETPVFP